MVVDAPPASLIEWPATAQCVVSASHRYQIPPEGLLSILMTEGGRPGLSKSNTNGSYDLGVMQVNTIWLRPGSPLFGYVTAESLKNDLCVNIHAAAWILASNMRKVGNIWNAVGRYHSPGNVELATGYMNRVSRKVPLARALIQRHPAYRDSVAKILYSATLSEASQGHDQSDLGPNVRPGR